MLPKENLANNLSPNSSLNLSDELGSNHFNSQDSAISESQATTGNGSNKISLPGIFLPTPNFNGTSLPPQQASPPLNQISLSCPATTSSNMHQNGQGSSNGQIHLAGGMKSSHISATHHTSSSLSPTNPNAVTHSSQKTKNIMDKNSVEYKRKRERNNIAVRKSRDKAKLKRERMQSQYIKLNADNKIMTSVLRDLMFYLSESQQNNVINKLKDLYPGLESILHYSQLMYENQQMAATLIHNVQNGIINNTTVNGINQMVGNINSSDLNNVNDPTGILNVLQQAQANNINVIKNVSMNGFNNGAVGGSNPFYGGNASNSSNLHGNGDSSSL